MTWYGRNEFHYTCALSIALKRMNPSTEYSSEGYSPCCRRLFRSFVKSTLAGGSITVSARTGSQPRVFTCAPSVQYRRGRDTYGLHTFQSGQRHRERRDGSQNKNGAVGPGSTMDGKASPSDIMRGYVYMLTMIQSSRNGLSSPGRSWVRY